MSGQINLNSYIDAGIVVGGAVASAYLKVKLEQVHKIVNSTDTELRREVKKLSKKVNRLQKIIAVQDANASVSPPGK